jgi:hypothetical protein
MAVGDSLRHVKIGALNEHVQSLSITAAMSNIEMERGTCMTRNEKH